MKKYVLYTKLRLTGGMAMVGFVVCFIIFGIYVMYQEIGDGTLNENLWWNIGYFIVMGLLIVYAIYFDKKQRWPYYILERDDGWMKYQIKYLDTGDVDLEVYLRDDMIVGIGSYKKKYYKKKDKWYIQSIFGVTDKKKVYGAFLRGWLEEPGIKEFDELVEFFKKKGAENARRMEIKVPRAIGWYDIRTWAETEEAKKMKEEYEVSRDKE